MKQKTRNTVGLAAGRHAAFAARAGRIALVAALALASARQANAQETDDLWPAYLDYAYVYSSADSNALRERLAQYGSEAGVGLEKYIRKAFAPGVDGDEPFDDARKRREAIAYLLHYLAMNEPDSLDRAVEAVNALEDHLGRHENRYWYHYVMAHRALELGEPYDFVAEVLDMWLGVVVPLETPYETLHTLSLSDSPNSGFVSALPYVFENTARLVLIRSQEMGLTRGLDPLAAIVRLLHDGRVGAHPDVIPAEASSFAYLDRIIARLDGPESDNGSLTFTLALFEASKHHDEARGLLASEDLSSDTLRAIRVAGGAYELALNRAETVQGQAAVYTRVLRALGEVYAAKQRLGIDPDIDVPFTIEGAVEVYQKLQEGLQGGWAELGYRRNGREAYIEGLHSLWEEIQETSLNAADYYLTRSVKSQHLADEHARNAARIYGRYLSFFQRHATPAGKEGVPQSAYFAAYEGARGFGDAMLRYGSRKPSRAEVDLATQRYLGALRLFPFEAAVWSTLTEALEKQGRENDYLELVRPVAEGVARSRAVDTWISGKEAGHATVAGYRAAFSDSLAMMYLGFSDRGEIPELEASVDELRSRRAQALRELQQLTAERDRSDDAVPASPSVDFPSVRPTPAEIDRRIQLAGAKVQKLEKQIAARTRAVPLFRAALDAPPLSDELRARRDHPLHKLLRRMYHEGRGGRARARK